MKSFKNPFRTKYRIILVDGEYIPQEKWWFEKWKTIPYHFSTSLEAAEYTIVGRLQKAVEVIKTYN